MHTGTTKTLFSISLRAIYVLMILSMLLSAVGIDPVRAAGSARVMCENDASLVGCWRMEEGSGTTLYDGGATPLNDGTYNRDPNLCQPARTGNDSYRLNGTGQYAIVPDKQA